jgi:hypothetical protein
LPKLGLASDERFAEIFSEQFLGLGFRAPPWASPGQAMFFDLEAYNRVAMSLAVVFHFSQFFYTDDAYFGYGPFDI